MEGALRLRTDWLVLVARHDRAVAGAARSAVVRVAAGEGLPTGPGDDHLLWTDPGQRVVVAAWRGPGDPPAPWHVDADGVTVVRGQLRRVGGPWTAPSTWATDVGPDARGTSGHPLDGHVGDGSLVAVGTDGRGVVATDPVGSAVAFIASDGELDVVASRPALAAWAVAPEGGRPARDPWAAACLGHAGHLLGSTTAHLGVDRVLPGTVVGVDPRRGAVPRVNQPWLEVGDLAGRSVEDLCDVVEEAIADQVVAALDLAEEAPVLDLTGGKDSRLVLAVALRRVGRDAFRTRTIGAPDAPDVRVATEVAERLGLVHESGVPRRAHRASLDEEVTAFLAATDGTCNIWSSIGPPAEPPVVRLSGTVAEALRADVREAAWWRERGSSATPTLDELAAATSARFRAVSGGFLRREVEARLDAAVRTSLAAGLDAGVGPDELLRAFYLRHHAVRFSGRFLELDHDHRVLAALSLPALRAASALDPDLRRRQVVHRTLVERASPVLAALPFAGEGWPSPPTPRPAAARPAAGRRLVPRRVARIGRRVLSRRPVTGSHRSAPVGTRTAGTLASAGASADARPKQAYATVAVARSRPDPHRRALVEESLADRSNPVWDLVDADRVGAAIDGFDDLPMGARQRLYGLAGAARWLSG